MRLILNNICSIKKAELDFNGITVLAGENNSGKSTISRALYSMFFGLYQINDKIIDKIISILENKFKTFGFRSLKLELQRDLLQQLIDVRNQMLYYRHSKERFITDVDSLIRKYIIVDADKSYYNDYQNMISFITNKLAENDLYYKKEILDECINNEFNGKISSVFSTDKISDISLLFNDNKEINQVILKDNKVVELKDSTNIVHNILYLDGQDVDYYLQLRYDDKDFSFILNHRDVMDNLLEFYHEDNQVYGNKNMNNYFEDFNGIGKVYIEKDKTLYKNEYYNEPINPIQISQGLKSILILRQLFYNNQIKDKTFIILDEPEINLHPKWQLYLAKLLCNMNKNMDIHMLLCSHSPYFITAIGEYSRQLDIDDKCTYYLTKNDPDLHINNVINLTNNPKEIFTTLYEPIITLREINNE